MRIFAIAAVCALLAACQSSVHQEIDALRSQLTKQQREIARLTEFVDAQANAMTACKETLTSIADYVINSSTLRMLREATDQYDRVTECADAVSLLDARLTDLRSPEHIAGELR